MQNKIKLELDGHIYIVEKDSDGNIVSKDELDGELCLRLLVTILDDACKNPALESIFKAAQENC